jgi:hypothetical protein
LYSAAHVCTKGYNANAPEKEIEITFGDEGLVAGACAGTPLKFITNARIATERTENLFFI